MVTVGCGTTSRIAASRDPSGSCMFRHGWAGENARSAPAVVRGDVLQLRDQVGVGVRDRLVGGADGAVGQAQQGRRRSPWTCPGTGPARSSRGWCRRAPAASAAWTR